MKLYKGIAMFALVGGLIPLAASPAMANTQDETQETVVVDGREYGPEDGVSVTTESFELTAGELESVGVEYGSAPSEGDFGTRAAWGASYATSTEYVQYYYKGAAKAAGNVYSGQRIIQVCIQYTRSGVGVADRRCSNASSNGSRWAAGPETLSYATDSLSLNGPKTVFNIQTTRINPNIL